jgi:glutaminase
VATFESTPEAGRFVSTGRLPQNDVVQQMLADAYSDFVTDQSGALSHVYPALARAEPGMFGLAVVSASGDVVVAGDARAPFPIMSIAKPFVFALVSAAHGVRTVRERVGVNPTGRAFNSASAVENDPQGRTNPMVNSGAIVTTSLAPGRGLGRRWMLLHEGLSRFAGHELAVSEATLKSARGSNHRNRALANMLKDVGAMNGDADEALELYTRQSCLRVSAVDVAVMGATLADGGTNPLTGDLVIDPEIAHATLAVMTIAGMYETSGDWLLDVGMPGKSGIGGGIVTVSPGKGALGTFSPLLDAAGNSVRGTLAARDLARRLGLDLLASKIAAPASGDRRRRPPRS